ncbi:MAG TPA: acylphosphatase [Solirubrobacteraceae bacterium]|nr:acylphosphatase [Solirubrobacteraceae bacterium]
MPTDVVRRRAILTGHVQGVFFRASIKEAADNEGVAGWASNRPDGAVEVVLEGPRDAVESVLGYCRTGPVNARVESAEVSDEEPEGLSGFETR